VIKIHLSKLLGERRISQIELARRTGIRPATINEIYWEFAERVSLEHIDIICKMLGCKIEDFMEVVYEDNDKNK
jgi:putative transcriptional regulator